MEVLSKNHIDIIGGQESWELDNSKDLRGLVINGLANPGRALKVREERVGGRFFCK